MLFQFVELLDCPSLGVHLFDQYSTDGKSLFQQLYLLFHLEYLIVRFQNYIPL